MNIKIGYALFIFSMCLGFGRQLAAQERRTVLLNTNPTETLEYKFENNSKLPFVIGEDAAKLHLWLHTNKLAKNLFESLKLSKKNSDTSIGQGRIVNGTQSLQIPLDIDNLDTLLELKGRFTTPYTEKNIIFNNSSTRSDYYSLNKHPRLVLDYEVSKEPYGTSWSQLNGNAQHSNRTDWSLGELPSQNSFSTYNLKSFEVAKANNSTSNYLSAYKNKAIIFGKDEQTKPYMAMLRSEIANQEVWRLPLETLPTKQPAISPDGKMFFVSEKNALVVVDLNQGKLLASTRLTSITIYSEKNTAFVLDTISNEITLGYDGTIYIPMKSEREGIIALSAYPSLKPRWFYNTINPIGPVSLSENEKMALFIETDRTSKKSRLVVLDNINGEILTQSEDILSSYTNDGNSYIPPVVVQTADKDTTIAYVLDGNRTSNKLYLFKVHYDQFKPKDKASLTHFKLIQSDKPTNEGISQPAVLNKEEVLLIKNRLIYKYNYKTDDFTNQHNDPFAWKEIPNKVTGTAIYKNDASIIILSPKDKSFFILSENNVFFRTGDNYNQSVLASNVNNAVLNQDMSLYVQLQNGSVQHVYPVSEQNAIIKDATDIQHKNTFIPSIEIYIQPMTINQNTQSIIAARQKIHFAKGFNVQKGASLTFQIRK